MIVNAKDLLEQAKKGAYAIPHFNINNLEWTRFILEACQEMKSPVILGVSEGAASYMGGYQVIVDMVQDLVSSLNITIPVVLHLDHGSSVASCKAAVDAGFRSVMIDASKYSLLENIEMTTEVVTYAHQRDCSVEAEIGHVGGSEDGIADEMAYATVEDALQLSKTGIDFLAPALGSVHGLYKGEPKLDFARMKEISVKANLPLVLHGGTGIDDEKIQHAIASGICKLNINTELQIAWANAVRVYLNENPAVYDPRKIIKAGEAAMKQAIIHKIRLLGSANRA